MLSLRTGLESAQAGGRRRTVAAAAGGAKPQPMKPTDPVLCKNCVHFRSAWLGRLEFGDCHHSYEIDLVTGEKTYMYASVAREYACGGEHFQQRGSWLSSTLGTFAERPSPPATMGGTPAAPDAVSPSASPATEIGGGGGEDTSTDTC